MYEVAVTLTYIHIHAETDCSVWRILLFSLNLPSFFLYLPFFVCRFSTGTLDSSWVLPEFNSDLNLSRSPFHHILPSSVSHSTPLLLQQPPFLHWWALSSLFCREWVVHVLFNIMRTQLPPRTHPSVLHEVWQQLLEIVMVEQEGAHQREMKKGAKPVFNRWGKEKVALLLPRKPSAPFLDNTEWQLRFLFNMHILFTHEVWKLLDLLSKVSSLLKE